MAYNDLNNLLETAKEYHQKGEYSQAESILNQLVLKNYKNTDVFYLLGTIYYDQGKFNKAIRSLKRALEIEPAHTDASVSLSIILNDLGRYQEGKKIFEEAKVMLAHRSHDNDPYIDEKIAIKHDEVAELYFRHNRYKEALEQYYKSLNLSTRKAEITIRIVECYECLEDFTKSIQLLKELCRDYPGFVSAHLKLGKLFYESQNVPEAVEQWEYVLRKDPNNKQAQEHLRLAQSINHIHINEPKL